MNNTLKFFALSIMNFSVLRTSPEIDIYQLIEDIKIIFRVSTVENFYIFLFISFSISILTVSLLYFFRIFSEIYLTYFLKFNYYFLINLVSISTIYLIYRVYGYSRLSVLIYLFCSVLVFYVIDKILKK